MYTAAAIASSGTFGFLLEFVFFPILLIVVLYFTIGRN